METALEWHPTWSSVGVATNQIERKETSLYKYLYKERDISCNNEQWFSKIEIASVASDLWGQKVKSYQAHESTCMSVATQVKGQFLTTDDVTSVMSENCVSGWSCGLIHFITSLSGITSLISQCFFLWVFIENGYRLCYYPQSPPPTPHIYRNSGSQLAWKKCQPVLVTRATLAAGWCPIGSYTAWVRGCLTGPCRLHVVPQQLSGRFGPGVGIDTLPASLFADRLPSMPWIITRKRRT